MKKRKIISLLLAVACTGALLAGCGKQEVSNAEHEAITMLSAFPGTQKFIEVVAEKYPEINLEIIPYSGNNMTAYMKDQLSVGMMPDIYVTTVYTPGMEDLSDRLIDLSSYSFTNNYAESQLRAVSDEGKLYLLPAYYSCAGITYNKTILEENGWALPTTFEELEALAPLAKEAGYNLAIDQISLPGYGFQYFCNILSTDYLNTLGGRKWQNDYLSGKASLEDSPEMMESLQTLEKWRDAGMLNGDSDLTSSTNTKTMMGEGHTLFMLGTANTFTKEESDCEFGLMPYLSKDGTQNALILNVARYVGLNKHLEDAGNEQKLEDAIHVMEVMSTVEGMSAVCTGFEDTMLLPLNDYVIPETNYFKQVEAELNAGLTAPFVYAGWDNVIVPIGNVMIDYICGNAALEDVVAAFDDNQHLLANTADVAFTTTTEELDTEECAKLVGICFAKASGADMALVSLSKWYPEAGGHATMNTRGVSGSLMPMLITDQEITSILPTGWHKNIETVTFTGARIKELVQEGYDHKGMGLIYPYVLVTPEGMTIDDNATYTAVICGVTDAVAAEGNLTNTGILGLTAMQEYLSQFETLSKKDIRWE